MERAVSFAIPEITITVDGDALAALVSELRDIADGAPRLHAARQLADRVESTARADSPRVIDPDGRERYALLRATNHLTRAGRATELIELRDALFETAAAQWRPYRLRYADFERGDEDFTSYALNYEPGDRLVTASGEQLRVAAVVEGDPLQLEVDPWRPNKPRQVATFVFERSRTRPFVSVSPDDGNALADELGRSNDDAAHSGAQKILAAMNLSTRSTRVRLSVAEAAAALAALVTLRAKCALHDPAALERELRARLGR